MEEIRARLREARESAGLSERGAAKGYGSSHQSVGNWERDTEIPAAYVAWLAERTGYSVAWLLLGRPPRMEAPPNEAEIKLDLIKAVLESKSTPTTVMDQIVDTLRQSGLLPGGRPEDSGPESRPALGDGHTPEDLRSDHG